MVCTSPTRLDTEPWLGQGQHYRAPRHGVDKPTVRRNQPLCRELLDERNQILPTITTNPYPWELYNVPKIHLDTNKYIHIHSQGLQFLPFIRTKYIYIYKHKRKRTHIHKTLIHKVKILSRISRASLLPIFSMSGEEKHGLNSNDYRIEEDT